MLSVTILSIGYEIRIEFYQILKYNNVKYRVNSLKENCSYIVLSSAPHIQVHAWCESALQIIVDRIICRIMNTTPTHTQQDTPIISIILS